MAQVKHHRAQPRKSDDETFDMFNIERLPRSLIEENTPPRFATVIADYGYVDEELDGRADFVRFMEYYIIGIANHNNSKRMRTLGEQAARAYRFYEHLGVLERKLARQLEETNGDESVIPPYLAEVHEAETYLTEAVKLSLKAMKGLKNEAPEEIAMLLEIPFMALRGSKSLLIVASKRGPLYRKWEEKYPYLWKFHKGPPDFDEEELLDTDLEDEGILNPTTYTRQKFNHAARPIWWGALKLGAFSKTCRRLVPLTEEERAERLHTPAMLCYWRTQLQKGEPLGPYDDYRT